MNKLLTINPADNVAVAIEAFGDIPAGHKVALRDIAEGDVVIKYGFPIGHATQPIKAGEWVHSHNLATSLGDNLDYSAFAPDNSDCSNYSDNSNLTIDAYLRKNGGMGIRNELWVVPTVGCVNSQAQAIAERLRAEGGCADDVRAFTHNYGCSQLGQ
ncbi:MAG: altronate dehydratase family protein, partial [Muribaculaceae bacterium]|nr:altronate dehydratase family protein [Muribaculaceae bacterium]